MWEKRIVLKYSINWPLVRFFCSDISGTDKNRTCRWFFQTSNHSQSRSLAATRRTKECEERTFRYRQSKIVNRSEIAEGLSNSSEFEVPVRGGRSVDH